MTARICGCCPMDRHKGVERIVYEPTGTYHKAFERFMTTQGVPLSKVNPRSARRFAEATGRLAKTDTIDAAMWPVTARFLNRVSCRLARKSTMT